MNKGLPMRVSDEFPSGGLIDQYATPVAPEDKSTVFRTPSHTCSEFGLVAGGPCVFCDNGYRAPEQITLAPSVSGKAAICPNCGFCCWT